MKDISNFNNIDDYLPILNASIISDLIIIGAIYYGGEFRSKFLMEWYEKYRLSAVIADVLILVIGLVLARKFLPIPFGPIIKIEELFRIL